MWMWMDSHHGLHKTDGEYVYLSHMPISSTPPSSESFFLSVILISGGENMARLLRFQTPISCDVSS